MNYFGEPDPALFVVHGECKVRTRKRVLGPGYQLVEAWPEEPPPERMTQDPCWKGDHWEFSSDIPRGLLSVFDTWVHTGVDTWAEWSYCLLELQERGFLFQKWDRTLVEHGACI